MLPYKAGKLHRIITHKLLHFEGRGISLMTSREGARIHRLTKYNEGVSVRLSLYFLANGSSDRLHNWWVCCCGPNKVHCWAWTCLKELFSKKLHEAIPEAKQAARSEHTRFEGVLQVFKKWLKINIIDIKHYMAISVFHKLPMSFAWMNRW